ncbi:MAG: glycoside hydrolase family 127 protein, partial [Phycisphaerales bacterium]
PEISGAYDNFLVAAGRKEGRHRGPKWHDGDFYKWLEAAAFVYATTRDEKLDRQMDQIIEVLSKAQRDDGYIHTPVIIDQRQPRSGADEFQNRLDFETYNMGHLLTCACVHYRATGKTNLLRIAEKAADFLCAAFESSPRSLANNSICPSHYMGLVELYRTVADSKYLELAKGLIDARNLVEQGTDHNQDRIPFREQSQAVGHAVRANYLYAGVADVYAETGDKSLLDALERIWSDVAYRKIYVTGATGALYDGASPDGSKAHSSIQLVHQAYGRPYQLPNITAYNESCATIGFVLWNWRMLAIAGEAQFTDLLELGLYNGVLATISLDGKSFFYTNPLARVDKLPFPLRWSRKREPYIGCFCCPPNSVRTIAEVSAYAYGVSDAGIWFNLYGSSILDTRLAGGEAIRLRQRTDYPWQGTIHINLEKVPEREFSVFLRIPGWSDTARVTVNGEVLAEELEPEQYFEIRRLWSAQDRIELAMPMSAQLLEAHPLIEEVRNQTAVRRGPLVYCLESSDLPDDVEVMDVAISPRAQFRTRFVDGLLGGVTVLETKAFVATQDEWDTALYRRISPRNPKTKEIRLIPYYAWGNRGDCEMTVWIPLR